MKDTVAIEIVATERGFLRGSFTDQYGEPCSIQESSLATGPCLWLGCDKNAPPHLGHEMSPRMHLTQDHARALIPLLVRFVARGTLEELPAEEQLSNLNGALGIEPRVA